MYPLGKIMLGRGEADGAPSIVAEFLDQKTGATIRMIWSEADFVSTANNLSAFAADFVVKPD
ncbi:hypothetical protein CA234_02975 [Sphingomonas sp. ABOLE]|nr:hypothetical protein CA234_02975 [Sphingomonas sp. ABOLE]